MSRPYTVIIELLLGTGLALAVLTGMFWLVQQSWDGRLLEGATRTVCVRLSGSSLMGPRTPAVFCTQLPRAPPMPWGST